jgi:hypothetical protein
MQQHSSLPYGPVAVASCRAGRPPPRPSPPQRTPTQPFPALQRWRPWRWILVAVWSPAHCWAEPARNGAGKPAATARKMMRTPSARSTAAKSWRCWGLGLRSWRLGFGGGRAMANEVEAMGCCLHPGVPARPRRVLKWSHPAPVLVTGSTSSKGRMHAFSLPSATLLPVFCPPTHSVHLIPRTHHLPAHTVFALCKNCVPLCKNCVPLCTPRSSQSSCHCLFLTAPCLHLACCNRGQTVCMSQAYCLPLGDHARRLGVC